MNKINGDIIFFELIFSDIKKEYKNKRKEYRKARRKHIFYNKNYYIRKLLIILLVLLLFASLSFIFFNFYFITNDIDGQVQYDIVLSYPDDSTMTMENYLLQIQYLESRYNHNANRLNSEYWGLYQIGHNIRKETGYGDISKSVFLNHPEIQHLCMIKSLEMYQDIMKDYINKYSGTIVDGILITESGILACSHLIGCEGTKRLLDKGVIPEKDINGNPIRHFFKLGGYKLNFDNINFKNLNSLIKKQ
jgi:hypothetical protein